MKRPTFRQATAWMHGWSGLLLGWLLFAMCLSGSLAVFKPEIGRWMRPEISGSADTDRALVAATDWLRANAAHASGWYLTAPGERDNSVLAQWPDTSAPGGFRSEALDPVSGRPGVARETRGGEFFYRLHFELELPYPWGRLLASFAAMWLLVAIVSGIVAHKRFFADFFTFRPGKGRRSWLDAHNLFGVIAIPFHLMITWSGLVTLASLAMPWGIMAAYGGDTTRMYREFSPGFLDRGPTARPAVLAPIAPMLAEAHRRFRAGAGIGQLNIANAGDAAAIVTITRGDDGQLARQPEIVAFDGLTGRVLQDWTERRPAIRAYDVIYGLHMGRFGRGALRWLYFLCGLLLSATIATGLILWTVKRREKGGVGNELLARLNAGVIAGTPIAFMAFFWANRLLPVSLAGRADAEVATLFWTWGAALALGGALPSRKGMPVLLGLAAIACAGGPVLTLFDAVRPAHGDHAILAGNLVMLAAALGFGWAARLAQPWSP